MFDRDRFDWELSCPVCGAKGLARASQDTFPDDGNPNFTVDFVSNTFRLDHHGRDASTTVIACEACNVIINPVGS